MHKSEYYVHVLLHTIHLRLTLTQTYWNWRMFDNMLHRICLRIVERIWYIYYDEYISRNPCMQKGIKKPMECTGFQPFIALVAQASRLFIIKSTIPENTSFCVRWVNYRRQSNLRQIWSTSTTMTPFFIRLSRKVSVNNNSFINPPTSCPSSSFISFVYGFVNNATEYCNNSRIGRWKEGHGYCGLDWGYGMLLILI